MEILNETLINSKVFELLCVVLKYHYEKRGNLKPIVSYEDFKELIIVFVKLGMKSLLEETDYYKDRCDCVIKEMPTNNRGNYESNKNLKLISINEDVIKKLYLGNIDEMITIFHELGHFKVEYELRSCVVNIDLVRIVKEKILRKLLNNNSLIFNYPKFGDEYYKTNYDLISEEKIVEMNAIKIFIEFLELADINISLLEKKELKIRLKENKKQYNNFLRDFKDNMNFNSNWLDFEEAFDFMISKDPTWLILPQLSIEYYIDESGNLKKRTEEELMDMLKTEVEPSRKQCIEDLLDLKRKKTISKADFIDYSNIEKALGLKFLKVSNNNDNY